MKKKAMLSQPMAGKTPEEIVEVRDKAIKYLEKSGFQVVDTYFQNDFKYLSKPLFCLGKSLMYMSYCDAVYFCKGWDKAKQELVNKAIHEMEHQQGCGLPIK